MDDTTDKDIRNLFRLKKKKDRIEQSDQRYQETFLSKEKNDYYEKIKVDNIWSNNYIEYKSNGDGMKTLSVKRYSLTDSALFLSPLFRIQCN